MAESTAEIKILEGFLCPICKTDLQSLHRLKSHFQEKHPEDQDVLKSLKDLFGKATKKILKLDEEFDFFKSKLDDYNLESEVQEIGYTKSHTKYFKDIRCTKLEYLATETNKLIIRLDQLLRVDSTDRKHREQQVVEWLDGTSVKLCPECAKSFNLTRRQHHCRLCGAIMCHSCSSFLSEQTAKMFISGIVTNDVAPPSNLDETNSLRLCIPCMKLLESRRRLLMNRSVRPNICELYDQLCTRKRTIECDIELYKKMCTSLHAGESTHSLSDTQTLRGSIAKQGEALDTISKKIAAIPVNPDIPRAGVLQNAIRRATSNYIKDSIVFLPALPTPEQLLEKRDRLKSDVTALATPQILRTKNTPKPTLHSGWSPAPSAKVRDATADPLILQMDIVRGYIKQAREALRFEEVASLEAHLRELKEAYYEKSVSENKPDV